ECQQRGIKLLSVYGSTESSPHAVVNLDDPLSRFMHTDGYAAAWLMEEGIDSLSLNPDTVVQTWLSLAELKK
ncbi:hypothetical protein ACSLNT_24535, partial [Escherichia coli]|uniref:hypothetical protein n=1 Tax=Escherichia coli TaxID=562 RepID=UPI003EDE95DB